MKSRNSKSISPVPKTSKEKENPNNVTSLDNHEASLPTSMVPKARAPTILLNPSKPELPRIAYLEKAFKGEFRAKSGKNTSILQDFMWEYVIVMPNPDFPGRLNEAVTSEMASGFYKQCFKAKKTGNVQKDTLTYLQEVQAFDSAFKSLNDIDNGKSLLGGGRLVIEGENFYDTGAPAKDFLTLVRNVVFYKLVGSLGLKVKQLTSKTGEFLFLVVTADEADLMIEAERTRFSMQLEIALSDIQSLIPCDEYLRPLHILKNDDPEIKSLYKDVKPFLSTAFGLQKNVEKVDYRLEAHNVSPNMWNAYKVYLSLLKDGIHKITSTVKAHKAQMFLFQKLVKDSIEKANLGFRTSDQLKSLWDRIGVSKPIAPFAEYRRAVSSEDELANLWRTHEIDESGKRSLFRSMERIRLIVSYIETEIGINFLQDKKLVAAHFPLHNIWQLKGKNAGLQIVVLEEDRLLRNILFDFKPLHADGPLAVSWKSSLINQKIPLSKVRNYYGEKIALYFEFLRYYQTSLLLPGLVGLIVFVIQRVFDEHSPQVLALNAFYSVFMTIWATIYLEGWKRKEAGLSISWGTTKFETVEIARPQFKGIKRRSPITDDLEEIYYPSGKRACFIMIAVSVSILILSIVLGIVAGLIILKSALADVLLYGNINFAGPVCSIINAVQIQVFNVIYSKLAKVMTDMENHKTENQYQDSYILKVFAFQFVNSFNSLVYIAFAKGYTEGCLITDDNGDIKKGTNCMNELYTQLISIFIVSYVKNLVEIGVPYIKYQMKKRRKAKAKVDVVHKDKDVRDKVETQLYLEYYVTTDKDGTIDDYMELAIQFGYLTLFAIAFPLSTSLAFVGLWFEMQTDKLKLLHLVRRPIPLSSKDIGTWLGIFSTVSVLAIFSNTALFCFTANTFDDIAVAKDYNYVIFAVVVIILLLFRNLLQSWIPDVSESFQIVQARQDYIVEKVLRGDLKPVDQPDEEVFDTSIYFTTLSENLKQLDLV